MTEQSVIAGWYGDEHSVTGMTRCGHMVKMFHRPSPTNSTHHVAFKYDGSQTGILEQARSVTND